MATQQLMFDILAKASGVNKTFQEVVDSADTMAGKLGAVGAKATAALFSPTTALAAGGIAGAALMQGLGTAMNMDEATRKMSAGLALTGPESERAGAAAGKLYSGAYGESFDEVTAAVSATMSSISGMRGASESDIQAMTGSVMDLSKAFEIDVTRTAQVAGQMITTGLAKDGTEAADLLAASLAKVPVNVREDVLDAIDEYGPMFANLGMSGGEAMTMLAAASEKGMYGIDKTGDALKEFTIRATDMSKASGDAYKSLGLDQQTMTNNLLAGGDTARAAFDTIVSGLGDIKDPAAQSQAALALFGTPIEDLGTAEIPKFIDSLLNSQEALGTVNGAAAKLGDTINSGPGSALTTFQRTAETSLGALGAQVLPVLTPILQGMQQFAPIIGPAVIALGALAGIIAVVTAVTAAWNFVMAMSPVTWIIVGIVALVAAIALLLMNWDTVVAFLQSAWAGFVGWFQGVMAGFVGWWNGMWAGFFAWTSELWAGFVGWITGLWNGYISWLLGMMLGFVGWWNGMWAGFFGWTSGLWSGFVAGISGLWSGFVGWIMGMISGFVGFWMGAWGNVGAFVSGIWSGFVSGAMGMGSNLIGFLGSIPGTILGIFAGAGSWLWDIGQNLVQGLLNGVRSLAGNIGNFFLNLLPGWIVGPFKAALGIASPSKLFAGYGENIGEGVLVGVDRMQSSIDNKMSKLVTVPELPGIPGGVVGGPGTGDGSGSAAGSDGGSRDTAGGLTDEDRQLMRDFIAAADRPLVATWNGREVLTATREAERKGNRR